VPATLPPWQAQLTDLQALQGRCQGQRATLRAQAALDSIRGKAAVESGVAGLGLKEHPSQRDQVWWCCTVCLQGQNSIVLASPKPWPVCVSAVTPE